MPHVITQSCCSDGSCVYACPVNCIHPSPDEPGFATAEMLYIDPVACVDCGACVQRVPGRRDRAGQPARGQPAALRRAERGVLPRPARRREAAADVEAGTGHRCAESASARRESVDGGDRRIRARGDVRRRRAADPAGCAGERVRALADALWAGTRRRGTRSPEHQAGHPAVRQDRRAPGLPVLPQRRGGIGSVPRRLAAPTITPCSTPSAHRTIAGSTSTVWVCPAPARPPSWLPGSTVIPNTPISQSIWVTSGW